MIQEYDVREKMASAIKREISIPNFARWIMSNSWNMHRDSSKSAIDLVSEIHALLAERDDFSLDDDAFLRELLTLDKALDVTVVNFADAPRMVNRDRLVLSRGSCS